MQTENPSFDRLCRLGADEEVSAVAVTKHLGINAISSRIEALHKRHQEADLQVQAEQVRLRPNTLILKGYKRRKLQLKDELVHCEGRLKTLLAGAAMA
ncbi:hypothetical protein ROA7450_00769 [Roseovarius albus]|uniref:Uncharacterized protein n=2 Tax=Roseovarius albus TaxID=1247867 RepID=A0A1X6YHH1_9RHOB|nr:hypothetical protein ROA7450_00769 [Roseovarius albus]